VLASTARLRRRDEFAATMKFGGRAARGALVVHVNVADTERSDDPAHVDGSIPTARAGFVVSKAVGGAVVRNKVKRRLRHLMRERLTDLPAGVDIVVRALPSAAGRPYAQLSIDLTQAIEAAARRPRRARR
jgi:ribonuclease P protein component